MELKSANTDPYSSWQHCKNQLAEEGFDKSLQILNPQRAKGPDGRLYDPAHLEIWKVHQFLEKDSYLSPSNGKMVPKYLLALQGSDDRRYYLEYYFKDPYQDTVLEFLANIDGTHPNSHFTV